MDYLRPHYLPIVLLTAGFCVLAQTSPPATATQTPPPATAPLTPSAQAPAPAPRTVQTDEKPPYSSFGDVSIGLFFWETHVQPFLKQGAAFDTTSLTSGDLVFPRRDAPTVGVDVNIPIGKGSMLRLDYFHLRAAGNTYVTTASTLFGQSLNPGDFVNVNYKIQNVKFSWDYLAYPFPAEDSKFRLRFLFEGQYTTITPTINAPLKVDAAGNSAPVSAAGTAPLSSARSAGASVWSSRAPDSPSRITPPSGMPRLPPATASTAAWKSSSAAATSTSAPLPKRTSTSPSPCPPSAWDCAGIRKPRSSLPS
jgi:hypothetical protein